MILKYSIKSHNLNNQRHEYSGTTAIRRGAPLETRTSMKYFLMTPRFPAASQTTFGLASLCEKVTLSPIKYIINNVVFSSSKCYDVLQTTRPQRHFTLLANKIADPTKSVTCLMCGLIVRCGCAGQTAICSTIATIGTACRTSSSRENIIGFVSM